MATVLPPCCRSRLGWQERWLPRGGLVRLFDAAQKYITVLSRAEVSQPTAFSRVIGRLCDDYGDLVSEVAPALYDGFSQELLWLVEEETQDVEAQCGLPA